MKHLQTAAGGRSIGRMTTRAVIVSLATTLALGLGVTSSEATVDQPRMKRCQTVSAHTYVEYEELAEGWRERPVTQLIIRCRGKWQPMRLVYGAWSWS